MLGPRVVERGPLATPSATASGLVAQRVEAGTSRDPTAAVCCDVPVSSSEESENRTFDRHLPERSGEALLGHVHGNRGVVRIDARSGRRDRGGLFDEPAGALACAVQKLWRHSRRDYDGKLKTLKARVEKGRIVFSEPTDLPEGTEVRVLVLEGDEDLEAMDPEERAELESMIRESLAQGKLGQTVPIEETQQRLRALK